MKYEAAMQPSVTRQNFDQSIVPTYAPASFVPVRAEGSTLWDQEGKSYIDFAGGIAVNALGHAHPDLQLALQQQAALLWHTGNGYTNRAYPAPGEAAGGCHLCRPGVFL